MKRSILVLLAGILGWATAAPAQESFPELSKRVPHLLERLRSPRWEARYCLLGELTGGDPETRRALEILAGDKNESVANQATVRYELAFLDIDRSLFRPEAYVRGRFPTGDLPAVDSARALVEYCLGARKIDPRGRMNDMIAPVPVLDPARLEEPGDKDAITIVGILGRPEDATALLPYLGSSNPYVALAAARAVLRLGDRSKGVEALCRLAERDPVKELWYVTEAFKVLKQVGHPGLPAMVLKVLAAVDRDETVQPNWVSGFLLIAADIAGNGVWKAAEPK
jgi:hypothetical protein